MKISKSVFENQMKWLNNKGYMSLNCKEFYLWHQGRLELPKKSVIITFDGGTIGQAENAMPILRKYNMKAVFFIRGNMTYSNKKGFISYKLMNQLKKLYPNFDFQSHTFDLHKHLKQNIYQLTVKDAALQKKYFNFKYLAYPYGDFTSDMIKAYKRSGIKMAFTYGKNDYATRKQDIYKIKRIKVNAKESFSNFTRWFEMQ